MSMQIASSDEIIIETILNASSVHADNTKIVVIIDTATMTDAQEQMLETDGLLVGFNIEDEMVKTKSQIILTSKANGGSVDGLNANQIIVEFEL